MLSVIKRHFKTMPVYYVGLREAEHTEFAARKTAGRSPARFAKVGVRVGNPGISVVNRSVYEATCLGELRTVP